MGGLPRIERRRDFQYGNRKVSSVVDGVFVFADLCPAAKTK